MSRIFINNQRQKSKKISFVLKSAFLIAAFILAGNLIATKTGITEQISKIFYWPDQGLVAGEYTVRIAAPGDHPDFTPSYPKTMRQGAAFPQAWGDASNFPDGAAPLIWSKYDMVAFSGRSLAQAQNFAREIKNYNPATIVLGFPGSLLRMPALAPDDYMGTGSYYAYRADGTKNLAYRQLDGEGLANFTKVGAGRWTITNSVGTGFYNGLTNNDLRYYDGSFYPDGRSGFSPSDLCSGTRYTNLDLDENGTADTNQAPNACNGTEAGVRNINERWRTGYDARINQERTTGGSISGKPWKIVINDGGPPIGDTVISNNFKTLVDGFMFENAPAEWVTLRDWFINWDNAGKKPSLVNWVTTVGRRNKNWIKDGQNDFQAMRFNLTTAMLGDAFFGRCIGEGNNACFWYDEFDLNLGQPKINGRHELTSHCTTLCPASWGCPRFCPYVRFFDNGAILVNPTGNDLTLSESDISGLAGYDGPYYRFVGGQDPVMNNGQAFGSVVLRSSVNDPSLEQKKLATGDGIILVKQQNNYSISAIEVGNGRHDDTSPGSKPVVTVGAWNKEWRARDNLSSPNPYYTQYLDNNLSKVRICRNSWNDCSRDTDCDTASGETCVLPQNASNGATINDGYPMVYTSDTTAATTATFTPTIGVAGDYDVYEWHGWVGNAENSYQEATNVPVEIAYNGGTDTTKTINQRINPGQWNLIGRYNFASGTGGYVRFSAQGVDGPVIADVVKFVYAGGGTVAPPVCNNDGTCNAPTETIANCPADCHGTLVADLDCDNKVGVIDLGMLMSCWDTNYSVGCINPTVLPAGCNRSPDIVINSAVDVTDFATMLSCWGTSSMASCVN